MSRLLTTCVALIGLGSSAAFAADVEVRSLRTEKVGDGVYFEVELSAPAGLALPSIRQGVASGEKKARWVGQLPRLVPRDDHTRAVYLVEPWSFPDPTRTLSFRGVRVGESGPAQLRLVYPVAGKGKSGLAGLPKDAEAATAEVSIDWSKAVGAAAAGEKDLRDRWARAQRDHFERQHLRAPGMSLFAIAEEINARKYKLRGTPGQLGANATNTGSLLESVLGPTTDQVFEMTTGATALTESLALGRVWPGGKDKAVARTVDVAKLPGIDVAEHPWKKMMGERRPAEEPFARLVPHDNWYLTVTSPATFLAATEVLDAWGGSVLRSPRLQDRDHGLRARYERQLCLPSAEVVRDLLGDLVRGVGLTGSDLLLLEGSDLTVLLEVREVAAFRNLHDAFIRSVGLSHGKGLKKHSEKYREHDIDSFVTPRREISLHRATIGKVVVCSNSPAGVRRVLDAHAGKAPALAESLDFQYMRTVFARDAKEEDGFAFLSDAFVRRLVRPATKIKERRRQQARAALTLAGAAALFVGADTGKAPGDTKALLAGSALEADRLAVPEGGPVVWDGKATQAISEVYNTLEFSTPLVELPIDKVTADEQREYERFREEYLRLWRRFFDPVGIRFKLAKEAARVEVYLLPLVNNSAYNGLRRLAGGGTVRYSPSRIPADTFVRFLTRLPADESWLQNAGIGDWGLVHLDANGMNLQRLVHQGIEMELGHPTNEPDPRDFPLLVSLAVADAKKFATKVRAIWGDNRAGPERNYRGVAINQFHLQFLGDRHPGSRLYDASMEKSYALTLNNALLERWIDQTLENAKSKPKDTVEVNTSLYLAPPAGANLDAILAALDWEAHKRALAAVAGWQALYSAGLVTPRMSAADREAVARRLLGYVPVSPDGAAFAYDDHLGQVKNERHGSLARPTFHARLGPGAGVVKLFRELRSLRADLRFREDGIHTTLTLDWKQGEK